MKKQHIFFAGGFPRAGSTILINILNQNPQLSGSPTSGLIGSLLNIKDGWRQSDIYRAAEENYVYPKIKNMMRWMLLGFYYDQIENGIIPIDKNRGWTGRVDLLDDLFETKVKIIYPIRNVVDCCISMELMNRKSSLLNHGDNGNWINEQTTRGRVQNFLKDDGIFGLPILYLRELMYRGDTDRLVVVPYNDLLKYPKETLDRLHNQLDLPLFNYDFNNIKQTIFENDIEHGFAPQTLHKIKEGKLLSPQPRKENIFIKEDIDQIETTYSDINNFINEKSLKL